MDPKYRKTLKATTLEMRHILEGYYDNSGRWICGSIEKQLTSLGFRFKRNEWGRPEKLELEEWRFDNLNPIHKNAYRHVNAYINHQKESGIKEGEAIDCFTRECAYTWANRLLALRCMESRGLIDEVIIQKETYGNRSLKHNRLARMNPELCAGEDGGLFETLFREFNERSHELPMLFDPGSPMVSVRPLVADLKKCIGLLSGIEKAISAESAVDNVFNAPDSIGWAYQYWNTEEKDRIFARTSGKWFDGKKHKIAGKDIIPATQLYTEPYMVKFLVQNSLGATWMMMHPESNLCEKWEYYVKDADRNPSEKKPIREITFLDPACGSGHFLIEAFDLYYDMYQEEGEIEDPGQICGSILENNLYGIDIDERAVQIAALALVMKAKEKCWNFMPRKVNLASTNIHIPKGKDHLQIFLEKHPEDKPLKKAIETIFSALENVSELGSLLQIEEPVDKELRYLKGVYDEERSLKTKKWQNGTVYSIEAPLLFEEIEKPKQVELPLGIENFNEWKQKTISNLKKHFDEEIESSDLFRKFFGINVEKGLSLFDILSRKYDIVSSNPPFLSNRRMGKSLKREIWKIYTIAKLDTYLSFIWRSRLLLNHNGRVALLTPIQWLFLRAFKKIRIDILKKDHIELIAHLGLGAFNESILIFPCMFILSKGKLEKKDKSWITALKATANKSAVGKGNQLAKIAEKRDNNFFQFSQHEFLNIPDCPIIYWITEELINILHKDNVRLSRYAVVRHGMTTSNNSRFTRLLGEVGYQEFGRRWRKYSKGGRYQKWYGLQWLLFDWDHQGSRVKQIALKLYGCVTRTIQNQGYYFKSGLTYTLYSNGSLGVRIMNDSGFDVGGMSIFVHNNNGPKYRFSVLSLLNSRIVSFLLRIVAQDIKFQAGTVENLPIPKDFIYNDLLLNVGEICVFLKSLIINSNILELDFCHETYSKDLFQKVIIKNTIPQQYIISTYLHCLEAFNELNVLNLYNVSEALIKEILGETGTPAGWFPLISNYETLPDLPDEIENLKENDVNLVEIPRELSDHLEKHDRISPSEDELFFIKQRLGILFEAGPGAKIDDLDIPGIDISNIGGNSDTEKEDEDEIASIARIPIPTETFLEELSVKMEIHPISIYWLLKEGIEKEGWRCIPEKNRITEDMFTVIILHILGHRWPKQIEAGEPVPEWADEDGIIPLIEGAGEVPLVEWVRQRIREDFPGGSVSSIEREFEEVVGVSLFDWLSGPFFKRHISQFKKRPIAWHLESKPEGRRKNKPAFSCLIYYHKLDIDLLPKIRSQYVGLLRTRYESEYRTLDRLENLTPDQASRKTQLKNWIDELRDFDERLKKVSTEGFNGKKLKEVAETEPHDEWCSRDGTADFPRIKEEFLKQEMRYDPDINDGVRVNIAPLQKAGLLHSDVLGKKDIDKAINDRAEWRADERRWCREEKLPRPGWWPEKSEAKV